PLTGQSPKPESPRVARPGSDAFPSAESLGASQSGAGHTAIVTGANHGIGAATAAALAQRGYAVLCAYLRVHDAVDPRTPQAYREHRGQDADAIVAAIRAGGGRALALEADLSDPATPALLFDTAEERLGYVDVLVNNATGWGGRYLRSAGHRPAWQIVPGGDG